ncbi:M3 family oligoendopeptidase [Rossellomorea sp. AcN35-11]|nr:M3 family oligoendopeptidase [Rossellomorea aquimaris]WJV28579.1 M3 family oligoendopeptidase [Rossellomorea sp. AcN35-11]
MNDHLFNLKEEFEYLINTPITSESVFLEWIKKASSLLDLVQELITVSYINYQCNIEGLQEKKAYTDSLEKLKPLYQEYKSKIDNKLIQHNDYLKDEHFNYLKDRISNSTGLVNGENSSLITESDRLIAEYFSLQMRMKVNWEGETIQVQELNGMLYDESRSIRERAYSLISKSYEEKEEEFQLIMDKLISLRDRIAKKAGFSNYRDYMFSYYERLDYSYKDCEEMAEAIRSEVVPIIDHLNRRRKDSLKVYSLKPWDTRVTGNENKLNVPYHDTNEMLKVSEELLEKLDPSFSNLFRMMKESDKFDLLTKAGKAPGGFCELLPQSKTSFIMLNIANTKDDLPIFLHEMGHAIHHDLIKDLTIHHYKQLPMETAEFAAMSIELLTLDTWRALYNSEEEFLLVKRELFQQILDFLPITIVVDQFQHWMYTNPHHSHSERNNKFKELVALYDTSIINWTGTEKWKEIQWMDIIHIFETPFYFIEYAIAQVAALQLYRKYKQNPEQTLTRFKKALALGSSKPIKEVYEEAGIEFNVSKENIREVMTLIRAEIAMP